MSLAHNIVARYHAGSAGYYEHTGAARWSKRGLVTVEYDSSVWVYRKAGRKPSEWRAFIRSAFVDTKDPGAVKLEGKFPAYTVA